MNSRKLYTPLRYPGGKAAFAPYIADLMKKNNLIGGHYLEPYAGGAGVALNLLFNGHASYIHINDLDPAVYAFWVSVIQHPDKLLNLLHDTPITIDEWLKWRAVLRGEIPANEVERGFATLFINRTNRSGILKGGVIGGINQSGSYKLDARFKKDVLTARIEKIVQYANFISVHCEDALTLLKKCNRLLPKNSLIYLDPPYYIKGKGLYRNYYKHDDHLAIAKTLQSSSFVRSWVISYDNSSEIKAMYSRSQGLSYELNYSAQKNYVGNEVMFFSKSLQIQDNIIPKTKLIA